MGTRSILHLQCFQTFRNCSFFWTFGFTKFQLPWFAPCFLWWTLFKSAFPTLSTRCILHLQCFQTFRNFSLFWTFWLFRNFYSVDAQHANDCKHSLNRHFQHCAHRVYPIYSVFKVFEIAVSFAHVGCYQFSTTLIRTMLTMVNIVQFIISDIGHTVYITFTAFKKLFEIAVCFVHFGLYEISTLVMCIMLTMAKIVQIIISNIAHPVYIRFTVFSNFSKLLFVLHILAY